MVIADTDGKVLFMNDSVTRVAGFSRSEAVGRKAGTLWGRLMPKPYCEKLWHRIKVEQKPLYGEITNHRKNGEKYSAAVSITPVFDDEQRDVEFVAAVSVISTSGIFNRE